MSIPMHMQRKRERLRETHSHIHSVYRSSVESQVHSHAHEHAHTPARLHTPAIAKTCDTPTSAALSQNAAKGALSQHGRGRQEAHRYTFDSENTS